MSTAPYLLILKSVSGKLVINFNTGEITIKA